MTPWLLWQTLAAAFWALFGLARLTGVSVTTVFRRLKAGWTPAEIVNGRA